MPIKFAVKIIRLKFYIDDLDLDVLQGHSGLAEEIKSVLNYLNNKASNKHALLNSVLVIYMTLTLKLF